MTDRVPIQPDTKVGRLLDDWPELEPVLVAQSPKFEKLANPILRRTVGKVATLAAAAKMGGLSVVDLVAALREAAGLTPLAVEESGRALPGELPGRVVDRLDADALLDAGENPLAETRRRMRRLPAGGLLLVRSSFRPEPLLDVLAKAGAPVAVRETEDGWEVLVGPAGSDEG